MDNSDINCADRTCTEPYCFPPHCTRPSWSDSFISDISIDDHSPLKDTAIIPAGGYLVVRIISNNPGTWFLHCHILSHAIGGMAMILNVASDHQNPPSEGFPKCGNFDFDTNEFYEKFEFSAGYQMTSSFVFVMAITLSILFLWLQLPL
ncbi:hypothetical protein LOD99_13388 [Oopsacas minuta]|uniref:Plastocyanin-like domain-containing protein n=1 Tax=Oopsacas minuta TaxID=111878 RepID=A0AAV7KKL1_9METZ|nr:hypothetical protein LOD99_13388 [Oopsacas minuta]